MASVRPSSKEIITALGGRGGPPVKLRATSPAVTVLTPAARSMATCSAKRRGEMTNCPSPSAEAEPMPW
jgi:hypothetical protein